MSEGVLGDLIEKNLDLAFEHFSKVPEDSNIGDNGDTSRIMSLAEECVVNVYR